MPKFNVSVSFTLRTEVEPEGIGFDAYGVDGVEDINDDSYYRRGEVECDGGAVTFVIECEDEDAAREAAEQIVMDGNVVDDSNGFGWEISDVSVDVEKVEIPMDLDRAKALVKEYLDSMEGMDDDLQEAFGFLLDLVVNQAQKITDHRSEITRLDSVVARQAGEIDRLTNGPDGSEAVTEVA